MIELSITGDVAEVVLNAPEKLNALSLRALGEMDAAYRSAEEAGVRALVLRSEGRAFCAGRDIAGVDPLTDDVPQYLAGVETLMRRIAGFPAPTFAAVHGACLGVGLGLAIATDVVYVADDAKIGSPFASLGAMLQLRLQVVGVTPHGRPNPLHHRRRCFSRITESILKLVDRRFLPPLTQRAQGFAVTLGLVKWNGIRTGNLRDAVLMGALLSLIPVVLAFLSLQRFWKADLAAGSVKA